MSETVSMPKLGFDMQEGTLVRWVKGEGESIVKGEVLAEIETDKATVEVDSQYSGVIYRQMVGKGTVVPVGTPIAIIVQPGEHVADSQLPSKLEENRAIKAEATETSTKMEDKVQAAVDGALVKASPLARRIAVDHGLDIRVLQGSGPGGRVVKKDVEAVLTTPTGATVAPTSAASQVGQGPTPPIQSMPVLAAQPGSVEKTYPLQPVQILGDIKDEHLPMDKLRLMIGKRMVEAKLAVPHFYITHAYDVQGLLKMRAEINAVLPEDQKISVNDFIVKAVALALRQFPNLNATISGNETIRHGHVHIGSAVSVKGGLLTVVCKDADYKSLRVISTEIKEMARRVREGKVRPDDIEGSTFSISNLGMYDVENFAAIINPPEAAILAVATAQQVPVVKDGQLQVGMRMKATLSADHRVTDGVEAAQFLQTLAFYLETPVRILI